LALSAIPPTSGFYSKDAIIEAVHLSTIPGAEYAYAVLLLGSFVTAYYIFRAFFMAFHGKERFDSEFASHIKEHWVMLIPLILLAIPSIFLGMFLAGPMLYHTPGMLGTSIKVLPQYDVLFSNEKGWTGADGAYSVALTPNTTAWFFGDTWIGQVKNGQHVNATLVNNSMAIQYGKDPATATMGFFYGHSADGSVAAFIQPEDGRGWFWMFDGVVTPKGLYVFLIQIERTGRDSVFDFKVIGSWLGQVDNPKDPPSEWRIRQFKVPWVEYSDTRGILWGSAVIQVKNDLYIYGTAEDRQTAGHRADSYPV